MRKNRKRKVLYKNENCQKENRINRIESFKDNQYIIGTKFHPEIMLRYKNKYAINFWNNLRKDLINIKRERY